MSQALEAVGSTQRVTVGERTMTSIDGDEWLSGTFSVIADSEVSDVNAAVTALRRLRAGATAEAIESALHRPPSSRWSKFFPATARRQGA